MPRVSQTAKGNPQVFSTYQRGVPNSPNKSMDVTRHKVSFEKRSSASMDHLRDVAGGTKAIQSSELSVPPAMSDCIQGSSILLWR